MTVSATVGDVPEATGGVTRAASDADAPGGRRLAANIAALAASQSVTWSLTLVWTLVVPRALGPQRMGLLVSATSVAAILGVVLGLGTRDYLVRQISAQTERAATIAGTAVVLRAALAPIFFVTALVYAQVAHLSAEGLSVLLLATGCTLLTLLAEPALAVFQALERMQYLAYSEILNKTVLCVGGIGLVLLGFGVVGLSVCSLAVAALMLVLNLIWVARHAGLDLRPGLSRCWELVRDGRAYWAFGVFFMVYLWVDAVMLGLLAPEAHVGWYGVATRLFTTMMFVPVIISTAWLPRLVKAFEAAPETLPSVARAPLEAVVLLGLPIAVVTATTSGPVVRLLFGEGYAGAGPALTVLAACLPLMYLNIVFNQILIAAKRPMVWTWVMLGATVVNPVLNYVLIRLALHRWHNGAIGAASSLLVTEVLILGVGISLVGRHVLSAGTVARIGRGLGAAAGMWTVIRLCGPAGPIVSAAVGCVFFAAAVVVLRLVSEQDMRLARRRLGAARARLRTRSSAS